jgi:hypothetical protein
MASKNRPCVSITGALYQRFAAECDAQDAQIGPNVADIIDRALDELDGDPVKTAAFCAALVKQAPPSSTIRTQPRKVYLPQAAWYRLYRARKAAGFPMSNVAMNSEMVNAMLDAAGAK